MNRGLSVVATVKALHKEPSRDLIQKSFILGWMVEWLQGFFLVADDIMDESITRRGKPCWFRAPGVGKRAINDSLLLQSCMHLIIREYFQGDKMYPLILDEFLSVTFKTEVGQLLDVSSNDNGQVVNFDCFTFGRYYDIACFKTAHYSFVLPVKLGFILCGEEMPKDLIECLLDVGRFFQVQDDYLDVYGNPSITGKVGTDIQEGKCSWLAVKALELMSADDVITFKSHYGKTNEEDVLTVRMLFQKYDMEGQFLQYENEMRDRIGKQAANIEHAEIVSAFANKLFGRKK